jgi:hypothetical protein
MSDPNALRFARWVFLIAGVLGLLEILPLYFMENMIGRTEPPPITHPGFFYGFIGAVLAWQVAFLIIASDPVRYRPLMVATFLEKLLYPLAMFALFVTGRAPARNLATAILDLVWLMLFVMAWVRLGDPKPEH